MTDQVSWQRLKSPLFFIESFCTWWIGLIAIPLMVFAATISLNSDLILPLASLFGPLGEIDSLSTEQLLILGVVSITVISLLASLPFLFFPASKVMKIQLVSVGVLLFLGIVLPVLYAFVDSRIF